LERVSGADFYIWIATICVFGFLAAYGPIAIAMPVHLHRRGRLGFGGIMLSLCATLITLAARYSARFIPSRQRPAVTFRGFTTPASQRA
jgi:hypothetical protein